MIVRVDEFPWMSPGPDRLPQSWDMLMDFLKILRAPCCLAVVLSGDGVDGATDGEIARLRALPGVTLAMHGVGHRPLAQETVKTFIALRKRLGQEPAIAIPPCNQLTQKTVAALAEAGYAYVCTGPETYRDCPDLKIEGIREVPSAWYGKLRDGAVDGEQFGRLDCVTLHLQWERCNDCVALREFAAQNRETIVPWRKLDA